MATASWSSSLRMELAKAAAVKLKEEGQLAGIHAGKGFPRPFVDQILEQIGVEYVD